MKSNIEKYLETLPIYKQQHLQKYVRMGENLKKYIKARKENPMNGRRTSVIRRVNLYGGPGVGKSTLASSLFATFKKMCVESQLDRQFELCTEFVKSWAWEGRKIESFDQLFIFANQQQREDMPLRNGVDHIFTDSPLFLGAAYARKYHSKLFSPLITLAELHEEQYPGIHIFLDRGNRPYVSKGRYEDADGAKRMDDYILSLLDLYVGSENYIKMPYNHFDKMVEFVAEKLNIKDNN